MEASLAPIPPVRAARRASARRRGRTLGPVADLEQHLPAEWWRDLFNATYVQTDGDVVENAANTRADVDLLLAATGLTPADRLLDLCCGQGRHTLELARRGFRHLSGIDRSRYLIRLARRRARAAGCGITFQERDARKLRPADGPFDAVAILGNSFGYFDRQADDDAVLAAVQAVLRPGGTLVMDISDGDWVRQNFAARSWEWIDRRHFVCRERTLSADRTRLVCREVVVHADRGVLVDQFYAERLYSRAQLHAILQRAGFTAVQDHGSIQSGSDRNQDLGMMAHRLFVTARRADGTPPLTVKETVREVTVLLGDPRLRDPVKRGGAFQPEDFSAVNRLKAALGTLPEFRFHYLDCHATLAADLSRLRPQVVLNFCDEGFGNNARYELHVPALLEMLGLPYSGSGPACLAWCFQKPLVCAAAAAIGIPVPRETLLGPDDAVGAPPSGFPAFVKPAEGDGSMGITEANIVHSPAELAARVARLRRELPGTTLVVQEFLPGTEYAVGLLGNPETGLELLPILEPDYTRLDPTLPRLLNYDHKWLLDSPYHRNVKYVVASLTPAQRDLLREHAVRLFTRLECRDYVRFDFRTATDGTIKLLEANPNTSWCSDCDFGLMAGYAGWSYAELLRRILRVVLARIDVAPAMPVCR